MLKVEPISILKFISTHFAVVRDLFDIQKEERLIRREAFEAICDRNNAEGIKKQLFEYKIIKPIQDDYELRDVYYNLIEFVLYEFRPLLPDEIEKYGLSITELFRKIKEGVNGDKTILFDRLKALSHQIKEFSDSVDKNKIRLLSETRDLKSNINRIDYREKIQRASYWTEHYIIPLNKILDVNHSESIANRLFEVSEFVNIKRLDFADESIRLEFEKLYSQLIQTNNDLLVQSKTLTNELLPLIERIRTESLIITGWIEFLKNPYKIEPPKLFKPGRNNPATSKIYLSTKEYFEQFKNIEDTYIEEDEEEVVRWIFNKSHYKGKLKESLPVNDFFGWCSKTLSEESQITNEKLLALTTLLFDEELQMDDNEVTETVVITTNSSKFIVPKIKIKENGV